MQPLISVIVPVYNVEKYVGRCIDSIRTQTYPNLEIILINDGSSDHSGKICEKSQEVDSRVKVISKVNGGLISARKRGVCEARGDYIAFVDGDDWIEKEMYSKMIEFGFTFDADIIASGFAIERGEKGVSLSYNSLNCGLYQGYQLDDYIYPRMMYNEETRNAGLIPSVSNKLFKREVIVENIMAINDDISNGEDAAALYLACLDSDRIYITDECWYHYIKRESSLSETLDDNYFAGITTLYKYLNNRFSEKDYELIMKPQIKKYIESMMTYGMWKLFGIERVKEWSFPFHLVKENSRIAIYGAGKVGCSYMRQLERSKYHSFDFWIDKNYKKIENEKVECIEVLKDAEVDYVIIAIENDGNRDLVKNLLVNKGIKQSKIIDDRPVRII